MANNKIFDILNKPVANPNKNGFDLSQPFPYSLKLGQVKPIYYVHTVADAHYKISLDELCHTEPFITDPFVRLSKHFEVVFVPYSQLWHGFSMFLGHSNDRQSSYEQGHAYAPVFSLGAMLARIWNSTTKDMQGLRIQETALSLLDMLGYGAHPLYNMTDEERTIYIQSLNSKYVNAWALLAYHKYWNCYLRDSQHTSPLSPATFNADRVPCYTPETSIMDNYYSEEELLSLVTIHYRKTKRDLFTSSLNTRQFGAVESVTLNLSGLTTSLVGNGTKIGTIASGSRTSFNDDYQTLGSPQPTIADTQNLMFSTGGSAAAAGSIAATDTDGRNSNLFHKHLISGADVNSVNGAVGLTGTTSGQASFDVYTLLTAQLMQKWREQIQRAGNNTDDRLRAIYGKSPKFDAKNMPYIIGSTSYNITANQVTATGASDGVKVGDIAAKGMGYSQRNEFEFDASESGIILVLTYILPENNYLAPIDKLNTLVEPFDYFIPQLENLGLEQIQSEFYKLVEYDSVNSRYKLRTLTDFDKWAARYWYYKTKVPVVHLGFEHGRENSKWYPSRIDQDPNGSIVNPFYVSPNEYDTVFGTTTDYHIDTDQFICFCNVNCPAVLPMSELGLPRW